MISVINRLNLYNTVKAQLQSDSPITVKENILPNFHHFALYLIYSTHLHTNALQSIYYTMETKNLFA